MKGKTLKSPKELYYMAPDGKLMAAAVVAQGSTFAPGTPEAFCFAC
jgi:hypothetical protein